ncbi:WD40 repeat-like protein [Mycena venus]|uniref:WD40 repeat-like protein n=1 Tax=Mycena venus TaxID=2733690 RepID=A0A8H6X222_9AGAR|nr:WD40 repeat-like protein [Mycena venus]
MTQISKLCLFISKRWAWMPVGSLPVSEITYDDILSRMDSKSLDDVQRITLKLTFVGVALTVTYERFELFISKESDVIETNFTAQSMNSIQFSAIRVTPNDTRKGTHVLRAISGGNQVIKHTLDPKREPQVCEEMLVLEPDCTLNILVQHQRYRWFRKSKLAAASVVHSEAFAKIEPDPTVTWYTLADNPTIELCLTPEDRLVSLAKTQRLLAERGNVVEKSLLKSRKWLEYILMFATPLGELCAPAKAVVGVVEVTVKILGKMAERDEKVISLIEDLARALEYVHSFDPESLDTLKKTLRELDTLGTSVIQLVQSAVSGSPISREQRLKQLLHLKSLLAQCMDQFEKGVRVKTVTWTKDLQTLLSAHYKSLLRELFPAVQQKPIPPCYAGTRKSVIEEIERWLDDGNSPQNILWLKGYPGSGKSTIASTLVAKLRRERPKPVLLSSFFFRRTLDESTSSSALHLWGSVMCDLCGLDPLFAKVVVESLEDKHLDHTTDSPQDIFRRLIAEPINACKEKLQSQRVFVVVDAVDECQGFGSNSDWDLDWDETMLSIEKWAELPRNFKLVITSRDDTALKDALLPITHVTNIPLNNEESNLDVRRFLEARCSAICRNHQSLGQNWPCKDHMDQLVARTGGLFIYAVTLISLLQVRPRATLQLILANKLGTAGPMGTAGRIVDLYNDILDLAFSEVDRSLRLVEDFKSIVGAIALTVDPGERRGVIKKILRVSGDTLESICNKLQSVLDPTNLQFRHQSFIEHLISAKTCRPAFTVDLSVEKRELTLAYLRVLQKPGGLRFDMGRLNHHFVPNPDAVSMKKRFKSHIVHASQVWGQHLDDVPWPKIAKEATTFLANYFLYWLELLSLVGEAGAAVKNLDLLETCIKRSTNVDPLIRKLIKDAKQFVEEFREPISKSAAHIYVSAFPFTSTDSEIFKFWTGKTKNFPRTISLLNHVPKEQKEPFKSTGKRPTSVASLSASPLGLIAIPALDRIWIRDPFTGSDETIPLHCNPSGAVTCVSFSPDGKTIVSGSKDRAVRLWNAHDTRLLREYYPRHKEEVTSVIFLEGGHTVASGSKDGMVRLWNATTGKLLTQCIPHNDDPIVSMACVAHDGFISISSHEITTLEFNGETIELDKCIFQAQGALTSMVCSQTGPWIVAGSANHRIQIWDGLTGQEIIVSPFSGHSDTVTCVAIHGNYVASGSEDHTIILWDCATGNIIAGPLHGHSETVTCVEFSRDGNHLFSGSTDGTVRMWDVSRMPIPGASDYIDLGQDLTIDNDGWIWSPDRASLMWVPEVIDNDGWIWGPNGTRWAWIPDAERQRLCWGRCKTIVDGESWRSLHFLESRAKSRTPVTGGSTR